MPIVETILVWVQEIDKSTIIKAHFPYGISVANYKCRIYLILQSGQYIEMHSNQPIKRLVSSLKVYAPKYLEHSDSPEDDTKVKSI